MKNRIIFIFLKNKIISLDSIIPFAFEMNKQCGFKFVFVVFDKGTYNAIKYDNVVLYDAINTIGLLSCIQGPKEFPKIIRKIVFLFNIVSISFKVNFYNSLLLHFGGLDEKPLVFIRWLFPANNRILCESSSYGRYINKKNIDLGGIVTKKAYDIYQYRTDDLSCFKLRNKKSSLNTSILLGFDKSWNYFKHKDAYKVKRIVFENSRNSPAWIDFLSERSNNYVGRELKFLNLNSKSIISFVIGRLMLKYHTSELTRLHAEAFKNSLISLAKYSKDYPIFIKPKVYDDMDMLKKFINEISKKYKVNFILTELHPLILASKSVLSVFVSNTTVINDFYLSGIPIVQNLTGFSGEYLDKMTSPLASHVVNNSNNNFDRIIEGVLDGKKHLSNRFPNKIESNIKCELFLN